MSSFFADFNCSGVQQCRSSLLEDLPEIENQVKSFCFSPKSQRGMQSNNFLTDMTLDSENTSSDAQSLSSSRYLQTHVFSPSLSLENEDTTASKFVSSQQKDFSPSKVSFIFYFFLFSNQGFLD